jgi:hypothetical protein
MGYDVVEGTLDSMEYATLFDFPLSSAGNEFFTYLSKPEGAVVYRILQRCTSCEYCVCW